ncbi:hypothetical protein D3C79_739010 [compost metagenome]
MHRSAQSMTVRLNHAGLQTCGLKAGLQHIQQSQMADGYDNVLTLWVISIKAYDLKVDCCILKGKGHKLSSFSGQVLDDGMLIKIGWHRHPLLDHQPARQSNGSAPPLPDTAPHSLEQCHANLFRITDPPIVHSCRRQRLEGPGLHAVKPAVSVQAHQPDERRGNFHPQK